MGVKCVNLHDVLQVRALIWNFKKMSMKDNLTAYKCINEHFFFQSIHGLKLDSKKSFAT